VVLTLTVSSVILIGRAQPIPERVAALHLGDMCALPCWIGITPGKTTVEQAKQIIAQVYSQAQIMAAAPNLQVVTLPGGEFFAIEFNIITPDDPVVQHIAIVLPPRSIRVGDVINRVDPIRLMIPNESLVQAQEIDMYVFDLAMGQDSNIELTSTIETLDIPYDPTICTLNGAGKRPRDCWQR
jgi:hypothetical protein